MNFHSYIPCTPKMSREYLLIFLLVVIVGKGLGQLNGAQKQYILDLHNEERRIDPAPNMKQMFWSQDLAEVAEHIAETCSKDQASLNELIVAVKSQYSWISESRHVVLSDSGTVDNMGLLKVFECWLGSADCDFSGTTKRGQILYPDTHMLGCGAYYFPSSPICRAIGTGLHLVCFYGPGEPADVVNLAGAPCTRCPSDAIQCSDNLCVPPEGGPSVPSDDPQEETSSSIPRVYYISPTSSSYGGGTRIEIIGTGFASDQFSTDDNPNIGNRVTLYNDDYRLPCIVERYYTTSEQIVCRTSASPEEVDKAYRLEVIINGKELSEFNSNSKYCGGQCTITYKQSYTPTISRMLPFANVPGDDPGNVTLIGKISSYIFADTQEPNEDDEDVKFQVVERVLVGGELCDPYTGDDDQNTTTYGGYLTDTSGNGGVSCRTDTNRIDSMNVSLILSKFGTSRIKLEDYAIDNKFRKYIFQTHPDITGIEPKTGSPAGGTLITITGKYFNDSNGDVKAFVSGIPCEIVNYNFTTIQCITGPAPPKAEVYPGGRGVVREAWNINNQFSSNPNVIQSYPYGYPNTSYNWTVQESFYRHSTYEQEFGELNDYLHQRWTTFFVPPKDGVYTFNFISDDLLDLYLSLNASREHKKLVAYTNSYTRERWDYFPTQYSLPFELKAGQPYYLQALTTQGTGPWSIGVAVKYHNLSWTDDYASADHEVQVIRTSSTVIKETQKISVTASPKIQVLTLDMDNSSIEYQLTFGSSTTTTMFTELTELQTIEDSLNSLQSIKSIGEVKIDMKKTDEVIELTIVFISTETNLDNIVVTDNDNYTFEITQNYQFNPTETFIISHGTSRTTALVNASSTGDDIEAELYELYTTECSVKNEGNLFFYNNYEQYSSTTYGGYRDNFEQTYCGRFSQKNPRNIYRMINEYTSFTATFFTNRYSCFYVRGTIPNTRLLTRVEILGKWKWRYVPITDYIPSDEQFVSVCVDLWSYFDSLEETKDQSSFLIQRIYFDYPSEGNDFWIDEFRIASSQPEVTQTIAGARPNGLPVDSVDVKRKVISSPNLVCPDGGNTTDCKLLMIEYTITYTVENCVTGLPLVTVSGSDQVLVTRLLAGSPAIGGTFDISFEGRTISNISASAEATDVKDALENSFGSMFEVTRSGTCSGYQWKVRWSDRGGDLPLMESDGTYLTGNVAMVNIDHSVDGGIWIRPLRGDMLRLPELEPQVEVIVNGIPASCQNHDCSFTFPEVDTASITSVEPTEGGQDGSPITITGFGFPNDTDLVIVTIGGKMCTVESINDTDIICVPSQNEAGIYVIEVMIVGFGYVFPEQDGENVYFTYILQVDGVNPQLGSVFGGNVVTLTGIGFPMLDDTKFEKYSMNEFGLFFHPDAYVLFDDLNCFIIASNYTHLSCMPQPHQPETVNVTLTVNNIIISVVDEYEYALSESSVVHNISQTSGKVSGNDSLTIRGVNFIDDVIVRIGRSICDVTEVKTDQIDCITSSHPPGQFEVIVNSQVYGTAYNEGIIDMDLSYFQISLEDLLGDVIVSNGTSPTDPFPTYTYELYVTSTSPKAGSVRGGTEVTITGKGFDKTAVVIEKLGGKECAITSFNDEEIKCVMPSTTNNYTIRNTGVHQELGNYFAWEPSTIEITIGSTVTWEWTGQYVLPMPEEFEVHQTSSLESTENIGFQSESSIDGSFSYVFTKPGTYFYSTEVPAILPMSGTIVVAPIVEIVTELHVSVNEFASLYNINYSEDDNDTSGFSDCLQFSTAERLSISPPVYVYSECYTPIVNTIDPGYSILSSKINITGERFGSMLDGVSVNFDGIMCHLSEVADNLVTCTLSNEATPLPFVYLPLTIHVGNLGYALLLGETMSHRSISVNPLIIDLSPKTGSLLGGNTLLIEGKSFSDELEVSIGDLSCTVTNVEYEAIQCTVSTFADVSVENISLQVNVFHPISLRSAVISENHTDANYTYSTDYTPMVMSVLPNTVMSLEATTITLTGFLLNADSIIMIGRDYICMDVMEIDDENITCKLNSIPAASYEVSVLVPQYGYAETSEVVVTSSLHFLSVDPVLGSIRGGTEIMITGNGFSSITNENTVQIGEQNCQIVSSNYSSIVCITPDLGTNSTMEIKVNVLVPDTSTNSIIGKRSTDGVSEGGIDFEFSYVATPIVSSILPSQGQEGDSVVITGNNFGDISSFDGTIFIGSSRCTVTNANSTSIMCTLGHSFIGTFPVTVQIDSLGLADGNVSFTYILRVTGTDIAEGSFAGQNLLTVHGTGFSPVSTFITICDKQCIPSAMPPSLTSVTCVVPSFADILTNNDSVQTKVCNVTVMSLATTVMLGDAYTFKKNLTSYVTAINDTRGGTAGGTIIQLTGSGFVGVPNVTIDGICCDVITASATDIVCMTGSIGRTIEANVSVYIEGKGYAIVSDDVYFYYVDLWSSVFTWGGLPLPKEGDFVIVGKGQTLVLDTVTEILKLLLIQGGELIFDDVPSDTGIQLHSELILIVDGGKLQIGTEDKPFLNKAEIVMYGNVLSTELPLFGAKTLAVRNGTVDFHGKPINNTWTKLSATAEEGAMTIFVQDDVSDWDVGGKLVIASTSYSPRENEEVIIQSIDADKRAIHLGGPLEYKHIYFNQTIEDRYLETSAEVGYLTRNIKFRGNRNEEWDIEYGGCEEEFDPGQFATQTCFNGRFGAETVGDQFGAQLMLHRGPRDKVIGRIEYTEFTHVGQAFRLGRYPIHFHLNGDVSDSYVRGNGIHHTFNRAVTMHAVDNLLVEKNVAYNILGHAYFLEDGIEQGNIIQDNLGVFVRASSSLLNVDITPATFWVVNPNNTLRRNAAAGGSHFGFWYRLPLNPTGPSFTTSVRPLNLPLLEFNGNTAHSFGWYGIWIFPSYHPLGQELDTCNEVAPAVFNNFFAWRNNRGIEFSEVGAVQLVNSTMLDNEVAGVEYTLVTAAWGKKGALIENTLIVGHSALRDYDDQRVRGGDMVCTTSGIKTPHSYYLTASGVTFVNFDEKDCVSIQACSHCRTDLQGGYETRFEKLKFVNSSNIVKWQWEHEQVFRDLDGSLTNTVGGSLIPWMNALPSGNCDNMHSGTAEGSFPGAVCDETVQFNRYAMTAPVPTSLTFRDLNLTNIHGTTTLEYVFKRLELGAGYMAILPNQLEYSLEWDGGERFTNISYRSQISALTSKDYFFIRHDFPRDVDSINVNGNTVNASIDKPDPENSATGDWFSDMNDTSVTFIVKGVDNCPRTFPVTFTTFECFFEDCIPPPPEEPNIPSNGRPNVTYMWSNSSIWPNGIVPNENDTDITINRTFYILVGENDVLPRMKTLTIYGGLEILDTVDRTIQADLILIDEGGQFVVGSTEEPYQHKLDIVLTGNLDSPIYRLPNGGPVLGAKAIGVFGQLALYGQTRERTWTFLKGTALSGSDQIILESPVDWIVGETIVIASTSFEANEAEVSTITDVSEDRQTITLDHTLKYLHLGGEHNTDTCSVKISAEVGLLSRNIRILGSLPDSGDNTAATESYGCRVLVGTYITNGGLQYTGSATLYGVEFNGCGQEGFSESFDPRFSLAFLNTGPIADNSSHVTDCSVNGGYNIGIGVSGTNNLLIKSNVVHNTVGASIDVGGRGNMLVDNLAVIARFPGTYRIPNEPLNDEWTANYKLNEAINLTLIGNSAAGGAKVGYHTNGENCLDDDFVPQWQNNIAHSTLNGIHIPYKDGHFSGTTSGCSALHSFHIHNCYHYGIFSYCPAGLHVSKTTLVNNYAALFVAVMGPSSRSHEFSDKSVSISDSRIIGGIHKNGSVSDCEAYTREPVIADHPRSHSGIQSPTRGHVGVIIPSFVSGQGHYPKAPWTSIISYPAISGLTVLSNVTFCNFGLYCGSMREIALMTNPNSEDCQHPVELSSSTLVDIDDESKFFNHDPKLGSINPSDCVDMDCDGLKKILIRDLDGSFIGSNTGLTTVTSNSGFEWDNDPRRGLGDFRIPRTMLAELDGGKKNPEDIYPHKGIYRGVSDQCSFIDSWNSYRCANIDHMMLLIESLDADTEVRRLSPIGIGVNKYIDLINGPQDHGWCGGYTCQERISTFFAIVAMNLEYTIGLTSTNPQNMRLLILNGNPTQKIIVGLFYNSPQRLDIFVDSVYITPTNGYIDDDGNLRYNRGSNSEFLPTLSDNHGTNYYDRTYKKLYFVIEGGKPIIIMTQPVIQLGIDLPPITVNEFFETNLVTNLALLLNIPRNRIRIVNVVSESSRKRQTSSVRVEIEIGSPPDSQTTNETTKNDTTTQQPDNTDKEFEELSMVATRTAEIIQTGELADSIDVEIMSASLSPPEPEPVDPTGGVIVSEDEGGPQPEDDGTDDLVTISQQQLLEEQIRENETQSISLSIPSRLGPVFIPTTGIEGVALTDHIDIAVLDEVDEIVVNLGFNVAWRLQALVVSGPTDAFLINNTVDMVNGRGMFSNLSFSHSGTYRLNFTVVYPPGTSFTLQASHDIVISNRILFIQIETQPPSEANTTFKLYPYSKISIRDATSREVAHTLGWRGRKWFALASIMHASSQTQRGNSVQVEIIDGIAVFTDISIDGPGEYFIRFSVETEPSSTDLELPNYNDSNKISVTQLPFTRFLIVYDMDFNETIGEEIEKFEQEFVSYLTNDNKDILIYNVSIIPGSIIISFFATSSDADTLTQFFNTITTTDYLNMFTYNGLTLNFTSVIQDTRYPIIYPTEPPKENIEHLIIVGVSIAVGSIILLVVTALTVALFCYFGTKTISKKQKSQKVKPGENIYGHYPMGTVYSNTPIFDDDEDCPAFHIVMDEKSDRLALARDITRPSSRSSTPDSMSKKEMKKMIHHVSSKEIKVDGTINIYDKPQMTQGDFDDKMSLDELLVIPAMNSNYNNNNNSNNNLIIPPPRKIESPYCHPNSINGSVISIPLSEAKPMIENLHGMKVTTFN